MPRSGSRQEQDTTGRARLGSDPLKDSLDELARLADRLVDNLSDESPSIGPPPRQTAQSREGLRQTLDELDKMIDGEVAPRAGRNVEVAGDKGSDIQDHLDSLFTPPPESGATIPQARPASAPRSAKAAAAAPVRPERAPAAPPEAAASAAAITSPEAAACRVPRAQRRPEGRPPVDLGRAEELTSTVDSLFVTRIEMPAAGASDSASATARGGVEASGEIATEVRIDLDPVENLDRLSEAPALPEVLSPADERSIEVILDDDACEASPRHQAPAAARVPQEPAAQAEAAARSHSVTPAAAPFEPSLVIEPAASPVLRSGAGRKSRSWAWIAGAAIVALLAGGGFWLSALRRGSSDPDVRNASLMHSGTPPAASEAALAPGGEPAPTRAGAAESPAPAEPSTGGPEAGPPAEAARRVEPAPAAVAPPTPARAEPAPPAAASRPPAAMKTAPPKTTPPKTVRPKAASPSERRPAEPPPVLEVGPTATRERGENAARIETPRTTQAAPAPLAPPPPAPGVQAVAPVAAPSAPAAEPLEVGGAAPAGPAALAVHVPPAVLMRQEPVYPPRTKKLPAPATIVLGALVSERGKVVRVVVEQGVSDPELESAAIDALLRSTYRPATLDGQPERGWVTETFVFDP